MSEQTVTTEAPPRPWRAAIAWMALVLGPGFFLVYGTCNGLTSLRTEVGSFFFEWERHVPVLPWTIVPYWSLDVFYAFSVLLCRNRLELDRHALRIVTAVLLSAVGFLLFPLRFGFFLGRKWRGCSGRCSKLCTASISLSIRRLRCTSAWV
jgi:hypothetical protein